MNPHRDYCYTRPPFDDEGHPTETTDDQLNTEDDVLTCYRDWRQQSHGTDTYV